VPPARTLPPEAARRLTASLSVLGGSTRSVLADDAADVRLHVILLQAELFVQ